MLLDILPIRGFGESSVADPRPPYHYLGGPRYVQYEKYWKGRPATTWEARVYLYSLRLAASDQFSTNSSRIISIRNMGKVPRPTGVWQKGTSERIGFSDYPRLQRVFGRGSSASPRLAASDQHGQQPHGDLLTVNFKPKIFIFWNLSRTNS